MKTEIVLRFKEIEITVKRDLKEVDSKNLLGMFIQAAKAVGIEYMSEEEEEEPKSGMFVGDKTIN